MLHLFGHYVGCTVSAAEQGVGFVVADYLFCDGVEFQGAAQAVGSIRQVHQRSGDVRFFDWGVDVLGAAAANAVDEIGVVVAGRFAVRAGFDFVGEPRFVRVVTIDGQIAVRSVKKIADGIGLGVFWTRAIVRPTGFLSAVFLVASALPVRPAGGMALVP